MKIVNNINGNHNHSIKKMLNSADQMILVSPFLIEDFDEFIHDVVEEGIKSILLITTLKDNTSDLFKKANSLYSFCTCCFLNGIKYEVRIDNKLHGKIYIAIKDGKPVKGIISSANFTDNGLAHNHEWGIEFDDSNMIQSIIDDLKSISTPPLTYKEIEAIIKTIDDYLKANPPTQDQKTNLVVTKHFKYNFKIESSEIKPFQEVASDVRYFLKPVGSSDQPFEESRKLNETVQEMHFSKRKPNSVRPGDILICYGVGTTKLLGYFRVLSDPVLLYDESIRWPWAVDAENLCPSYSSNWSLLNNTLSSIQASFGNDKELTFVGGKSLGALNFGADKIRLNEEFAHYIINLIKKVTT